jgi:hypothetical protein
MGLKLQSNLLQLTDGSNNVKFTTAYRMPHILGQVNGTIVVPDVPCSATSAYDYEYGSTYYGAPYSAETSTNNVLAIVPSMVGGEVFSQAFFTISAGDAATGDASIVGNGSTLLRIFRDSSGYFVGSMILTCGPAPEAPDYIVAQVRTTFNGNDFSGYTPIIDSSNGTGTLGGSGLIITYRVYYGRFT